MPVFFLRSSADAQFAAFYTPVVLTLLQERSNELVESESRVAYK